MKLTCGVLAIVVVGVSVGACAGSQTPAQICTAAETVEAAKGIIWQQADQVPLTADHPQPDFSSEASRGALQFELVTVAGQDEVTGKTTCSAQARFTLTPERSGSSTLQTYRALYTGYEDVQFLPGFLKTGTGAGAVTFSRQPSADGSQFVYEVASQVWEQLLSTAILAATPPDSIPEEKSAAVAQPTNTPARGRQQGSDARQGRCHMGSCSWSRELSRSTVGKSAKGTLIELTLQGGESIHEDGDYDDQAPIKWNRSPHRVHVFCSRTLPLVMQQFEEGGLQTDFLDIRPDSSPPGVLDGSLSLYMQTCHPGVERGTAGFEASNGYSASEELFLQIEPALQKPADVLRF